ncbi:nuclease-related domain-containing protein [Kocuria sp. U4B]
MAETARSQGDTGAAGDDRCAGGTKGCSPRSEHRDLAAPRLVVKRWRRYGHDRLYVAHPGGVKLGWWDLVTDEPHPEAPQFLPVLVEAVAGWKAGRRPGDRSTSAPVDAVPGAAVTVQPVTPAQAAPSTPEGTHVVSALAAPAAPEGTYLASALAGTSAPAGEEAGVGVARPVSRVATDETTEPVARPWVDLAANTPGAQAREQARTAREAAPVKTVVARLLGVHTEERAWRIGADGEVKVAARLAKVVARDPRWRVLHAIPVGERGADIDHLVIGPGGVFTVNAKHHPGARIWVGGNTVLVNGHRQPYVRTSRHEAARATRLLSAVCGFPVAVEGLIVTVRAEDVVIKQQPDGVSVVSRHQLTRWLLRQRDIHAPEVMEAVYEAARRSTTWQ